jgi:hypothetical protein
MDDESMGGFLFSYENLFSMKKQTNTDLGHEKNEDDNSISRIKQLLS